MVDIYDYDSLTGFWTHSYDFLLSEARAAMASAVVGDLAIFAGGVKPGYAFSDRVDIYNFTTNSWSTATLSQARGWASATTIDDKVLIAGGLINMNNPSALVDIYNATTGEWTTDSLKVPRCSNGNAATVKGKAYFAGGGNFNNGIFYSPSNVVDIYDEESDIWSTMNLIEPLVTHSVVGVGDKLIVAGGDNGNDLVQTIEILEVLTKIESHPADNAFFTFYPNPCNNILTFNIPNGTMIEEAVIYNQTGQKVLQDKPVNNTLNISKLHQGLYIIELETEQGKIREKLIVQ
jgi:N-acetylneuraminic acid mutarotase